MFLPLGTLASSICSLSSSSCFALLLLLCFFFFFSLLLSSSCFCSSSSCFALCLFFFCCSQTRFGLPDLVFSHLWVPYLDIFGKVGRWITDFAYATAFPPFSWTDVLHADMVSSIVVFLWAEATFFHDHCATYTFRCRSNLSPNRVASEVRSKSLLVGDEIVVGVRHRHGS